MTTLGLIAGLATAVQYTVKQDGTGNFTTIQACVDTAAAGDLCSVSAGTYAETVVVNKAVEVRGSPDAHLIGRAALPNNWQIWNGRIYRQQVPEEFRFRIVQAFIDGTHASEARWPNAVVEDYLNASSWATFKSGSVYGMLVDPELATTGIDWNGAIATMNIDDRIYTYTRTVMNYTKGGTQFNYSIPLPGTKARPPAKYLGSLYYLSGLLAALDAPGEWFYDPTDFYFYVYMPDGAPPGDRVSLRVRDLCYSGTQANPGQPLMFSMFNMTSCTYTMMDCNGCRVSDLNITYPTHVRELIFRSPSPPYLPMPNSSFLSGNDSTVERVHLRYSALNGILMIGFRNTVTDCLLEFTNWLGTLDFPTLYIGFGKVNAAHHLRPQMAWGEDNLITKVTLRGFGNSGIVTSQLSNEVSYAYVRDGGLIGCDHAGIHVDNDPVPCMFNFTLSASNCSKSIHHNVVHDCREKCVRGDDASMNITAHDMVIYNCGWFNRDPRCGGASSGLVLKGNYHTAYDVTVFNVSGPNHSAHGDLVVFTTNGPPPPSCNASTCKPQNVNSSFWNIAAHDVDTRGGPPIRQAAAFVGALYQGNYSTYGLTDPTSYKFAPLPTSPLYHSGTIRPPYTPIVDGHNPDIGGVSTSGPGWRPGCISFAGCWDGDDNVFIPGTMN
ncbi:hypothetical protein DIPPA_02517 [Diplonema papillatum]|nr:hypothetical protein DIPPA_02517 [Diplonema papillatum]